MPQDFKGTERLNVMGKAWALVTGASSGIGYEFARLLAARGYPLLIVSNEEQAIFTKGEMLSSAYGVDVRPLYMDLGVPEAAERLYRFCQEQGMEIEVVVNNAGMFYFGEVSAQKPGQVEKMILLHVLTPTMLCRLFGEDMKRRKRGYVLNMSSLSAWIPYPGIALYASTKVYLKSFSRAFRSEMYDYGVNVTTLCPGGVATNLYRLSDRLLKLAIRLGFMMKADRLAEKGIKALFRRRSRVIPGWINHVFLPLLLLLPAGLVRWIMRRSRLLPKN